MSSNGVLSDSDLEFDLSSVHFSLSEDQESDESGFGDILDYYEDNDTVLNPINQQLFNDFIDQCIDTENPIDDILDIIKIDQSLDTTSATDITNNVESEVSLRSSIRRRKRKAKPVIKNRGKCLRALFDKLKPKSSDNQTKDEDNSSNGYNTRSKLKADRNETQAEAQNRTKSTDNKLKNCQIILNKFELNNRKTTLNIIEDIKLMYSSIDTGFKCIFCEYFTDSSNRSVIENHIKLKHWNIDIKNFKTQIFSKLGKRFRTKDTSSNSRLNSRTNNSSEPLVRSLKRSANHIDCHKLSNEKRLTAFINKNKKKDELNEVFVLNGINIIITRCANSSTGPKFKVAKISNGSKRSSRDG